MSALPEPFNNLETLIPVWSISGSAARAAKRDSSTNEQREALFNAVSNRLQEALAYLDNKSLEDFDDADQHLMNLLLSYAHVSLAVEVQGDDEGKLASWRPKMQLTCTPAGV